MPIKDVVVTPMTEDFILWRCLHRGGHTAETIEDWPENETDWATHRAINVPLLRKLIQTYGTCAMLAWDGDRVVGFLRFYPKVLSSFPEAGGMCLQQGHPAGTSDQLVDRRFPSLDEIENKELTVHCLMTGTPFLGENPYQRKGIGTRMAQALIEWATARGWKAIEARAHAGLNVLYANTGNTGTGFWKKLGFTIAATDIGPEFEKDNEFTRQMRQEAQKHGLDPEAIKNVFTMRMDLL